MILNIIESKRNLPGVYIITNYRTGDSFIGSCRSLERGYKQHLNFLFLGTHWSERLQKDWIEEEGNIFFEVLEVCLDINRLKGLEELYVKQLAPGYQTKPNGKLSEETKRAISAKLTGKVVSEETKAMLSESMKKVWEMRRNAGIAGLTDEHKQAISEGVKHAKRSEESKQKMRDAWDRRRAKFPHQSVSEETRKKMSDKRKEYWANKKSG